MLRTLLTLLVCTLVLPAGAAEIVQVEAARRGGWLELRLSARELLDARTSKTIHSGLPGSCVYRLELLDERGTPQMQRLIEFALHFDVWEERYILESAGRQRSFASLAEADSAWSQPTGIALAPLSQLGASAYRVRVEVAVRPIAAADRLRLSEYVRQGASDLQIDVGLLFARLAGGDAAARESFVGPSFHVRELPELP